MAYNTTDVIICELKPQFNSINYNEIIIGNIFSVNLLQQINIKDKEGEETGNFSKFNGKRQLSYIVTFDLEDPFCVDWNNGATNKIIQSRHKLNEYMREIIKNELLSKNLYVYTFFKYWKEQYNSCNVTEIILNIIETYNKMNAQEYAKPPSHILEFFNKIKGKIEDEFDENEQKNILNKYCNQKQFIKELDMLTIRSIDRYFKLIDNYDDVVKAHLKTTQQPKDNKQIEKKPKKKINVKI